MSVPTVLSIELRGDVPAHCEVMLVGNLPSVGLWDPEMGAHLRPVHGSWKAIIQVPASGPQLLEYKYAVRTEGGTFIWEDGDNHALDLDRTGDYVYIQDHWRVRHC